MGAEAHECVPTQNAYDAAVRALEKHRADAAHYRKALTRLSREHGMSMGVGARAREVLDTAPSVREAPNRPATDRKPCACAPSRRCVNCQGVPPGAEDMVAEQVHAELSRLRSALDRAEADRATLGIEVERYSEWSNDLAGFVPEDYNGSNPEGAQEGIILDWVRDLVGKSDRYRDALSALTRADNQWARDTARNALVSERQEVTAEGYGGEIHNGVPLVALGEDADFWTAYGHHPEVQFAEACRDYLGEDFVQPGDVRHVHAVMEHRDDFPEDDGWNIRWRGVTADDDKAFPLTVWSADEAVGPEEGPTASG